MTSACGVVENPQIDDSKDVKCAFVSGSLKANGDIFQEFYYDLESMTVFKVQPSGRAYTIGDEIPVCGESYSYPDDFDIVVLRDKVAVSIRGRKITEIKTLSEYSYGGVPVINGRGFAVHIKDEASAQQFKSELAAEGDSIAEEFFNKWLDFETYRRIVFKDRLK
jgi:sulfate adenylyltransferase subunit 1